MRESRSSLSILKNCGHCIHENCLKEAVEQGQYQCPICKKSMCDLTEQWIIYRMFKKIQPMPDEFKNTVSYIVCNDCEIRSYTDYHFAYHECKHCDGFNTTVIDTKDYTNIMPLIIRKQTNKH